MDEKERQKLIKGFSAGGELERLQAMQLANKALQPLMLMAAKAATAKMTPAVNANFAKMYGDKKAEEKPAEPVQQAQKGKPGRNDPCPCGAFDKLPSGVLKPRKFKNCCLKKITGQHQAPKPKEPTVQPIDLNLEAEQNPDAVAAAMERAGVRPECVYAFRKTGLFLTEQNMAAHPPQDVAAWEAAIKEFEDGSVCCGEAGTDGSRAAGQGDDGGVQAGDPGGPADPGREDAEASRPAPA